MGKARIAITFALTLFSGGAAADPSPEVKRLMDDPVTMLDWGMSRLRETAREMAKENREGGWPLPAGFQTQFGWAGYDWQDDKIVVGFFVKPPSRDKSDFNSCRDVWQGLRTALFISQGPVASGNEVSPSRHNTEKFIAAHFSHWGFARAAKPQTIDRELAERIYLKVSFGAFPDTHIACESPLAGEHFSYTSGSKAPKARRPVRALRR
jgi:hypothetical protein